MSDLTGPLAQSIQAGALRYTYRGVTMMKDPFDIALYTMLIWEQKPWTIIEIGSSHGGSGLWLADLLRLFLPESAHGRVLSFDISPVHWLENIRPPNLEFYPGDARDMGASLSQETFASLPRPLLVIEDADHSTESSRAVLDFFAPILAPGEMIIVEDGNVTELYPGLYGGGPHQAISEFLAVHPDFEIDRRYCDWFGENVTHNPDGFLRKR